MQSNLTNVQHLQVTELMQTLTDIQLRMSRVKNTFPHYYNQLQQTYKQMLTQAKKDKIVPPWMRS